MDVFSKIAEARPSMSKNQKKIADFIEKRYDEAIYLTAVRLSREVGVSEATIIRFAEKLGYEGYPEFQRALLEASKPILTSGQRMNVFHNMKSRGGTLPTVLASDSESIRRMLDTVDPKAFRRASDMISVSQGIYVLGVKSSAVLASFMAYYLSLLFKDVKVLNGASSDEIAQQLYRMEGSDLLIAISFPRYSNRTISAMKFANSRGLRSIAITDSPDSPIASYATLPLYADCGVISYVDSIVPPMSLINALLVDVGEKMSKSADKELSELEGIWSEYGSYSSRNTP